MKNANAFKSFLSDEINLNQNRIDTLEQKIESIKTLLKESYEDYIKVEKQGSYAMHTIIKPVRNTDEFDADLLIYIKEDQNKEPKDYINNLYKFFENNKNYSHLVIKNTRCVTLNYKGDFHLDLVPCIKKGDNTYIFNSKDNIFEETDGTGYREWLEEQTKITNGELKRVTRLMKFMRDHKSNFSVKSILLTTLLGNTISSIPENYFNDTPSAFYHIFKDLNQFLQNNQTMPKVKNPVLPNEDFNRNWDENKYNNFREKINIYFTKIEDAYNDLDHNSSIKKWRKIFGDNFGKLQEPHQPRKINTRKPYCPR
ncbi:MAG: SMODS domain-containing nucleotidyltransferase [Pleomorphochaeta sp.]